MSKLRDRKYRLCDRCILTAHDQVSIKQRWEIRTRGKSHLIPKHPVERSEEIVLIGKEKWGSTLEDKMSKIHHSEKFNHLLENHTCNLSETAVREAQWVCEAHWATVAV